MADTVSPGGIGVEDLGAGLMISGAPARYDISGAGYLGGEYPGGTTTLGGTPSPAEVRVLHELPTGDWQLAESTMSAPDGTWRVIGLNPELFFHVVGRLAGCNDIIMSNIKPMRTDMISYQGELIPNEAFDGMDGHILLLDGMPPFAVQGASGIPTGLVPTVIDGRKLIVDGTTTEPGEWEAETTITDANGNIRTIPIVIPIGLDAPSNLSGSYSPEDNEITLAWTSNSHIEQGFYIYRSDSPLDLDDLPPPIGSVGKGVTEFVDGTVVYEEAYYYAVAAVWGSSVRVSGWLATTASTGDPHWDKVVSLLHFDGEAGSSEIVDETGRGWISYGQAKIRPAPVKFGSGSLDLTSLGNYIQTPDSSEWRWQEQDFTLELMIYPTLFRMDDFGRPCLVLNGVPDPGTANWHFGPGSDGSLRFVYWGGSRVVHISPPSVITLEKWSHIAMTHHKAEDKLRLWVDGEKVYESSGPLRPEVPTASIPLMAGLGSGWGSGNGLSSSHIDELRITKGVARYTENFTPPTGQFLNR